MPDFLANVLAQRRYAQARTYQQAQIQQRMLAAQRLEEERQRQAAYQQQVNQRILQGQAQSNALGWARLRMDQADREQRDKLAADRSARQELAIQRGPLKPGYRWESPTSVRQVLVENGPEWNKLKQQHAKDLEGLQTINNGVERFIGRLGNIQKPSNVGGFEGNFGMFPEAITRYLPGENYDTKVQLEQLENMAKTSELRGIRDTGGAIGSITEKEWPIIASRLLNFGVGMSDQAARDMFDVSRREMLNMRNREMQSYRNKWKDTPFYQANPIPVPSVSKEGDTKGIPNTFGYGKEVWDNLTDEEKNLWLPGMTKD